MPGGRNLENTITSDMKKSLISIRDFTKEEILHVLETAKEFEQNKEQKFLEGKVIASLFFEPSTRTRLSFETAINRLGAKVIGFSDATNTSQSKGETLKDTIKMVSNYVDMIVMRHPLEGSSRYASEVADVPVVNAGDGANQHPSQTLLDLYSILQTQGTLEGLTINMVGDLKYGRTTHSLIQAMSHFNPKFIFTSPDELKMPKEYKGFLDRRNIEYIETDSLDAHLNECDILYMTRVQQERFTDPMEYERVKDVYTLNASMLGSVRDNMKILHPLPRVTEIDQDVDDTPYAYYFKQAENGLYVRMAIISYLLGYR
jgi:aspartate carbamoyltransferase catalytic subunit